MTQGNEDPVEQTVSKLVGTIIRTAPPERDVDLFDANLLDSFGLIELVGELEREFGIGFSAEDLIIQNFANIKSITEFVRRRVAKQQGN
jgi:acyl carrier protein